MTMTWHMDVDFTPLIACVVSSGEYSFEAISKTCQCVIAVPGANLIDKVVDIGNCSGIDTDKFEKFGLTPVPATNVKAPLIAECLAKLEGLRAWREPRRKERRTFHANGDGPSSSMARPSTSVNA